MSLTFCPFSPSHCGGRQGERAAVWCIVAGCQVKPRQEVGRRNERCRGGEQAWKQEIEIELETTLVAVFMAL